MPSPLGTKDASYTRDMAPPGAMLTILVAVDSSAHVIRRRQLDVDAAVRFVDTFATSVALSTKDGHRCGP
jgi:predicted aspartyl protease